MSTQVEAPAFAPEVIETQLANFQQFEQEFADPSVLAAQQEQMAAGSLAEQNELAASAPVMDHGLLEMYMRYGNTEFGAALGRFLVTDLAIRTAVYYGVEPEPEFNKWARLEEEKDSSDE